jgi:hypothetical protein
MEKGITSFMHHNPALRAIPIFPKNDPLQDSFTVGILDIWSGMPLQVIRGSLDLDVDLPWTC